MNQRKQRNNTFGRRIFCLTLNLSLVLSGLSVPVTKVQAEETQATATTKNIAGLGTGMIADPTDPGDDTTKAWPRSYVYYGKYDADGDKTVEPIDYRTVVSKVVK